VLSLLISHYSLQVCPDSVESIQLNSSKNAWRPECDNSRSRRKPLSTSDALSLRGHFWDGQAEENGRLELCVLWTDHSKCGHQRRHVALLH